MESVIYDLKASHILSFGSQAGLELLADMPTFLISPQASFQMELGKHVFTVDRLQAVLLRPGDAVTLYRPHAPAALIYCLAFECYRLDEKSAEQIVYRNDRSMLPVSGWVSGKLPFQASLLLQELVPAPSQDSPEPPDCSGSFRAWMELVLKDDQTYDLVREPSLQAALNYIGRHYDQPLTRASAAQFAGFNTSYFSTLFIRQTGWGFSEYLNRVRIDRAKEHLLASHLTVGEIAAKVGYSSGFYLSRKFKQLTGMTPLEFRFRPAPQRIAAFQFAGALLALGLKPTAVDSELLRGSLLLSGELSDVPVVNGSYSEEQFAELDTDLVIAPSYFYNMPGRMQRLEKIAPVLALEWDKLDPLSEIRMIGGLLKREQQAEDWISRYNRLVHDVREKLLETFNFEETAAVYEVRDEGIYIWNRTARGAYNLFDSLGLQPPDAVRQEVLEKGQHLFITEDMLPGYLADHMFVIFADRDSGSPSAPTARRESWEALVPARRGRLYELKLNEFWCSDGLALERQLLIQARYLMSGTGFTTGTHSSLRPSSTGK